MKTEKYILPVEATTLAHYYSRACIAPVSYLKRGYHDAIQSIYPNALLLTEHYGVKGCNCYLVIRMTENELKGECVRHLSDDFILYAGALPISRVDEIVFNSDEQKNTTITNVEMGNAFVQGSCRLSVEHSFEQIDIPANSESIIEKDTQLMENLKEYDRVMGALMFMRLAKEQSTTYSDNFLQTLALFSPYLLKQLKHLEIDSTSKYKPFFDEKYKDFRHCLQNFISDDIVREFARTKNVPIKIDPIKGYDFRTLSKNKEIYILALLQNFSLTDADGGRDKIDDLILNGFYHRNFIVPGLAEGFAFYYGYNRGYDKFRNQYKLDNKCTNVKFYFDTFFEKFISESVFSYIVVNKDFRLDDIFDVESSYPVSKKVDEYTYQILDKNLTIKKKLEQLPEANRQENKFVGADPWRESGTSSSENKNLIDIRCAEFLSLHLTKKGERKEIAKLAGLSKIKSKTEKEVVDFLLRQPIERLEKLYANWKDDSNKQKAYGNSNKVKVTEVTEERNKEPNLFAEHE